MTSLVPTAPNRKPSWLKVALPGGQGCREVERLCRELGLNTVCSAAHCPNRAECWDRKTATFLILGDVCTRNCRFCAVNSGRPAVPDTMEPQRIADAVKTLGLRHAVVTSVTRDDLIDGGAAFFAETIRCIRECSPGCTIEVLVPDFLGSEMALGQVLKATPNVLAHNLETVPSMYGRVRPQAHYGRSLQLLHKAKELQQDILTKSGLMLGCGETVAEIRQVMRDLRHIHCDVLTIGQYLRPSRAHLPVEKYWHPDAFEQLQKEALALGFVRVEAGPLVRSSYRAEELFWQEDTV